MKKKTQKPAAKKSIHVSQNGYGLTLGIPGSATLDEITRSGIRVVLVPKGTKAPKEVFTTKP